MAAPRSEANTGETAEGIVPLEILELIANASPDAFSGLALTSTSFFGKLTTPQAWRNRLHCYLTVFPQPEPYESDEDYFWRHYKNAGLAALDKNLLDDITPENLDRTFTMLAYCVDNGLEKLAARLIQRLKRPTDYSSHPNYFTEKQCKLLFSQPGLYTNKNPVVPLLLLDLIRSLPKEAQHRILIHGCFMSVHPSEENLRVGDSAVVSQFWQLLPSKTRENFFSEKIDPGFIIEMFGECSC